MRGVLCLALCSLLVSASVLAHDVEDDFDDEAEVEVEAEDTVVVEKVTINYQKTLLEFAQSCCFTTWLNYNQNR